MKAIWNMQMGWPIAYTVDFFVTDRGQRFWQMLRNFDHVNEDGRCKLTPWNCSSLSYVPFCVQYLYVYLDLYVFSGRIFYTNITVIT